MASTGNASLTLIARNIQAVRGRIANALAKSSFGQQCTLVAVSKTKPVEDLKAAYEVDQRHFGENYIQELVDKAPVLPSDIKWHFIGRVQSNKAKTLVKNVPNLFVVETVDSIKLANLLNKASGEFRNGQLLNVMVQVNTSEEDQKNGTTMEESVVIAKHIAQSCEHLHLLGLMTIGRYGDTTSTSFDKLVQCRRQVAKEISRNEQELELSMGMSADFELAIECGSTFVRVGSTIFGERDYSNRK